jgi:phenylpyruvate tautomerase PptA (4-oxalocrotonate tautomerase family)
LPANNEFLPAPRKAHSLRIHLEPQEPAMPLVRISLGAPRGEQHGRAIADAVHRALGEAFDVPEADRFQVITDGAEGSRLIRSDGYLGNRYTDDLALIQITVNEGRSLEKKRRLYRRIVELVGKNPGLRSEDVVINLIETRKENWSFGRGEANYAPPETP